MSYPVNKKKNCAVYNKSFDQDILAHTVSENTTELKWTYPDQSTSIAQIKFAELDNIKNLHKPNNYQPQDLEDIWLPAIVSNDNNILYKEAILGGVLGGRVLGIEECVSFPNIKLKNWELVSGNINLCIDWLINSNQLAYNTEYGGLFWYKKNSLHKKDIRYTLDKIPKGTRIRPYADITYATAATTTTIKTTDTVIKIDNNTIKLLNKDSSRFDSVTGNFVFNTSIETEIIPMSQITGTNLPVYFFIEDSFSNLGTQFENYDLWISNGEFFSYFLNDKDKFDRFNFSTVKRPTRSYLSPSLYHIYRSIYNTLTHTRIKKIKDLDHSYKFEKLQKLCYILATSPLIDKVNINYLQDEQIQSKIQTYIDQPADNSINDEIQKLINLIADIFIYYKQQSFFLQKQTLSNNYIVNKDQLYSKLINKYGGYIKISGDTNLKYKKALEHGQQAFFSLNYQSFIDKTADANIDIYNDIKISLGDFYIETQMNPDLSPSGCLCKIGSVNRNEPVNIPLANMVVAKIPDKLQTVFNKDIAIKLLNNSDEGGRPINITQQGELEGSNLMDLVSYSFTLVDGPNCLRFSDFATNGRSDVLRRNKTSADPDPMIFVKQTGLYTIQGTTSFGSTLKSVENIRVYVHNDNNEYEPNKNLPQLLSFTPDNSSIKYYRSMCPNLRQFAINKNGLIWFIDTDIFVRDATYELFPRIRRLTDKKFTFPIPVQANPPQNTPVFFNMVFKPNTTKIKLRSVNIENMRSDNQDLSQCKSFYEPKLARQRDTFGAGVITGAARFYRINRYPDSLVLTDHIKTTNPLGETSWNRNNTISFGLPNVSTTHAPAAFTYGGYSQNVINKIGVEIPYHPIKVNSVTRSYKTIPLNTIWGSDLPNLTTPESGVIASDPARISGMVSHNDMGGSNSSFRCHLVDVPVTGNIEFDRGYFHPNSGWYSYLPTEYNPNGQTSYTTKSVRSDARISSIKKFDVGKYNSYNFIGPGFYDIRSINQEDNRTLEYKNAIQIVSYADAGSPFWNEQDPNYGVRNFNGMNYRNQELIDDFIVNRIIESPTQFDCDFTPTNQYVLLDSSMENLTIEDVELKINYMNIANPKNMIIALEVYNPNLDSILGNQTQIDLQKNKIFTPMDSLNSIDRLSSPITWYPQLKTNLPISDVPTLDFLEDIRKTNTLQNKPNTRVLYLFNQEPVDNYSHHFSLLFSDSAPVGNTFCDENKISVSGVSNFNDILLDNSVIRPCISPTGYSEKQSILHKQIIKNNNITLIENSFAKFKKLPLKNTTFTLKVYMVGANENIQSLDVTLLNSQLSGLSKTETFETSNNIRNSICNWNIIVHTKNTTKFTTQDYLGSIDYESDKISSTGYNYLADLTDREFLLPKVNLNAPYPYISTNLCKFPDNEELSRPLTYRAILFPFILGYTPRFFTLVGALADIAIMQTMFAIGGRGDPLISMLLDIRFQRQQEEQERFFFKPVYAGSYNGVPDKALIQASKDRINWYRMEVPIFKYDNTAILENNKYKYIKLHKDKAVPLSNFFYQTITDLSQLVDPLSIKLTTTRNISLNGLNVQVSDTESVLLKDFDMVNVVAQSNVSDNGVYYARSGTWVRYPDPCVPDSLQKDKLLCNNSINKTNIDSKKIIAIPGYRAFNIFDKNENITVMNKPAATGTDIAGVTIIENKALLHLNNKCYTVLSLTQPMPATAPPSGYIGKTLEESNNILIYKDNTTYNDEIKTGKWGLCKTANQKKHIKPSLLDMQSVATSEGSIGYGSNLLEPPTYSIIRSSKPNIIQDTEEILDTNKNNKIKYNNITIYENNTPKTINFSTAESVENLLRAYPYDNTSTDFSLDILSDYILSFSSGMAISGTTTIVFTSGGGALTGNKLSNLKNNYLNNSLMDNDSVCNYIDLKSNKFKTEITIPSGELILENDYIIKTPIQPLTTDQLNIINTRLTQLKTKSATPLGASQINFDLISSIPDLETFCATVPMDPTGCLKPGGVTPDQRQVLCSGSLCKEKLLSLYSERNELLSALEQNKNCTSGVLPYLKIDVSQNPTTNVVSIKNTPKNYYFIHIDANQECSLSYDTNVKILKKATYVCSPVVEFYQFPECDTICKNIQVRNGIDEDILSTQDLVYENKKIDQEKAKYPGVQWSNNIITMQREFFLSCEDEIRDTLVKVTEEYIVPVSTGPQRGLVKNIFDLDNNSKLYIRFRNIPRKLKTIDNLYYRYLYDYWGRLGPDIIPPKGGPMYNNFMIWQCIKARAETGDPYSGQALGEFVDPPYMYKWMNEMIFRAFFGSVDGIENKNTDMMDSKEMWEWIPYEYF